MAFLLPKKATDFSKMKHAIHYCIGYLDQSIQSNVQLDRGHVEELLKTLRESLKKDDEK